MEDGLKKVAAKFSEKKFAIGKTNFAVEKLLPMEAFAVLEDIRAAVGEKLATVSASAGIESAIVTVALSVPPDAVKGIMEKLFLQVTFSNQHAVNPMVVAGNMDTAFVGLEPVDVYEVFIRALSINFFSSFQGLLSRLGAGETPASEQSSA